MTELKQISFSLFKHIYDKLQAYCDKTGQNITATIRQAVYEFLDKTVTPSVWIEPSIQPEYIIGDSTTDNTTINTDKWTVIDD